VYSPKNVHQLPLSNSIFAPPTTTLGIVFTQQALRLNSHFQMTNSEARYAVYRKVIRTLAKKLNCIFYSYM